MIVYYNGHFVEKAQVAISPDDRGFLFADGIYEVIRSYRGRLFKCREHVERLAHGRKELRIEGVDAATLEGVAKQLLEENKLKQGDALIYLRVTRGAAPRNHEFCPRHGFDEICQGGGDCAAAVRPKKFHPYIFMSIKLMEASTLICYEIW